MKPLARTVAEMPQSGIREIANLAARTPDCVRLDLGEPHFPTPPHIVEAACQAARDGFTKYTPPVGLLSLRQAISEKLQRVNGLDVPADRIVAVSGATSGLFTACLSILEHGDEILLPDPAWPNWDMMVLSAGGKIRYYPADSSRNFLPDPGELDEYVGDRTRGIILNSPSNPTGAVMSPGLVREMVDFARRHDLWVIADECYDEFVFDEEHACAARFDGDGRVISLFSCSKTYAMTGWRVGYVACPQDLIEVMAKLQQPVIGSICSVAQKAAEAAFRGPQDSIAVMRDYYRVNRDLAVDMFADTGIRTWSPGGAFYMMVDISSASTDTYDFAKRLVRSRQVSVAPGETFGPGGRGLVRLSLATARDRLETGLARVIEGIQADSQAA